MITMSSRPHGTATNLQTFAAAPVDLSHRVGELYELAQRSDYVFGSPLGPFPADAHVCHVPRFVYFGPHTSQESLRLAVLAGIGRHDRLAANALLSFVEGLARQPDIGQSLNVSFFPVVNVGGLLDGDGKRDLSGDHWARSGTPEIALLRQDTARSGFQGFVRVTTAADDEPLAWVRTVRSTTAQTSDTEVFSSADFHPWPVRFETVAMEAVVSGPLSIAALLPFAPFEVELALPADWPQRKADLALARMLKRLIVRYRGLLAYAQHL
jgi:hypothetical protein